MLVYNGNRIHDVLVFDLAETIIRKFPDALQHDPQGLVTKLVQKKSVESAAATEDPKNKKGNTHLVVEVEITQSQARRLTRRSAIALSQGSHERQAFCHGRREPLLALRREN